MKQILFTLTFTFLLLSCNDNATDTRLVKIDSLFNRNLYDSAYNLISKIDTSKYGENDKAYYILLRNHALYRLHRTTAADSTILQSIRYYKSTTDKEKLARAYIGRVEILSSQGLIEESTKYLKEAENILDDIENLEIHAQVYAHLSHINRVAGNKSKALEYAKKALEYANKANSKHWIGYCLDNLGVVYYHMKSKDKYKEYIKRAEPYIPYQPLNIQAEMLDNLSSFHKAKKQYGKAEAYLKKSLNIYATARTYGLLAELYSEQGKNIDIDSLWEKAIHSEKLETRQYTMRPYAEWLYNQGRYKEASDIALRIPMVTDSLYQYRQTEAIKDVQDSYDRMIENIRHRNEKTIILSCTVFFIILLLVIWMYYHLKSHEAKKQLAENQIMMTSYTSRIKQLEDEGKDQSKEVKELRRRLEALRNKQAELLYKGKEKYESITIHKETALTWHKEDYNNVVEYYRTINMPFVIGLERNYKHLSAGNKFLLLLSEELKYNDEEIYRIMGMNNKALRTQRYRIRKEKIKE